MRIDHHPSEDILLAYAAGDLPESWSLLVATHIALCPVCRADVSTAEAIGGSLLADETPAVLSSDALAATLMRVQADDTAVEAESAAHDHATPPILPQPLRGYCGGDLDDLKWKALGRNAQHIPLVRGADGATARLLKIPAGQPVPTHGHNGLELTLVLQGSFVDGESRFGRGDVETADDAVEHQPVAEPGLDCICLAVTDAPLRFRSPFARLVQPLIGI
ncbi:MAG: transcriptional regulator [Alphaproteobacteria bacterium]|nr:transcriptional regulator [Alphaproteobacteria bacterium]